MRKFGMIAWAGVAMIAAPASAQVVEAIDHSALRICADPAALPFSDQNGTGFENRIANLLAKDLGVAIRYTWFPNAIGFYRRTLNARRCDIVIGAPVGLEMAQTTKPYYRSSFVLVSRAADKIAATQLQDPTLSTRKIGVQARTPVVDIITKNGWTDNLRAYDLMVDSRATSVGRQMIDDLDAGKIDVAVIWGPVAAYQAGLKPGRFKLVPLSAPVDGIPLAYDMAMAVRAGEPQWQARIDRFLVERRTDIAAILADARIPLLPIERPAS